MTDWPDRFPWRIVPAAIGIASGFTGVWTLGRSGNYRVQLNRIEDWSTTVLDELAWAYVIATVALWVAAGVCLFCFYLYGRMDEAERKSADVVRWRHERLNEMQQSPRTITLDFSDVRFPGDPDHEPPPFLRQQT